MNLKLEKKLISDIIKNENALIVLKNRIIKEIEVIKNDPEKCKIVNLTILLVGRHKIGKKNLIKYMLKSGDKDLHIEREGEGEDFKIFTSQKEPYFRLIKYKGIGYDENNKPEDITKKQLII